MVSCITISHRHRAGEDVSGILHSALTATFAFAGRQALQAQITQRLAIIVEEIVSNVLGHADPGRDIALTLQLQQGDKGIFVTLEDDGAPFDPRRAPLRELPNPDRGGGVGLALVKAWSDIIGYDRARCGNRLVLRLHPYRDGAGGSIP